MYLSYFFETVDRLDQGSPTLVLDSYPPVGYFAPTPVLTNPIPLYNQLIIRIRYARLGLESLGLHCISSTDQEIDIVCSLWKSC